MVTSKLVEISSFKDWNCKYLSSKTHFSTEYLLMKMIYLLWENKWVFSDFNCYMQQRKTTTLMYNNIICFFSFLFITRNVRISRVRGARGVMVIVVGNGHGDTSSNTGRDWLHFTQH